MPSSTHGAVAGAASMSPKKRHKPKVLKGKKHHMDREMNTPQPGPWANRVYNDFK